jgi:hypothetical protein
MVASSRVEGLGVVDGVYPMDAADGPSRLVLQFVTLLLNASADIGCTAGQPSARLARGLTAQTFCAVTNCLVFVSPLNCTLV